MKLHRIDVPVHSVPSLDPGFLPIGLFRRSFLSSAGTHTPAELALERSGGQISRLSTFIHDTAEMREADCYYIDRIVKTLLWMKGGFRIYVKDNRMLYEYLQDAYREGGSRAFDAHFMSQVYERPFEVLFTDHLPEEKDEPQHIGGHTDGCRYAAARPFPPEDDR